MKHFVVGCTATLMTLALSGCGSDHNSSEVKTNVSPQVAGQNSADAGTLLFESISPDKMIISQEAVVNETRDGTRLKLNRGEQIIVQSGPIPITAGEKYTFTADLNTKTQTKVIMKLILACGQNSEEAKDVFDLQFGTNVVSTDLTAPQEAGCVKGVLIAPDDGFDVLVKRLTLTKADKE